MRTPTKNPYYHLHEYIYSVYSVVWLNYWSQLQRGVKSMLDKNEHKFLFFQKINGKKWKLIGETKNPLAK